MASSNQRIGLDVDPAGRYLLTGSRDSQALVYDLTTGACCSSIQDADAVNDVAFHPFAGLMAMGTGERHYAVNTDRWVGVVGGRKGCWCCCGGGAFCLLLLCMVMLTM